MVQKSVRSPFFFSVFDYCSEREKQPYSIIILIIMRRVSLSGPKLVQRLRNETILLLLLLLLFLKQ